MRTLTTKDIAGSWFPSGYHGHFRTRPREDFVAEYRYLAKPEPPVAFQRRCRERPDSHVFSHHDNKKTFQSDPSAYFQSKGLGKRRIAKADFNSNSELITWVPLKSDLTDAPYSPAISIYKETFNLPNRPITQLLVDRPRTSFDGDGNRFTTMYRSTYCGKNPNKAALDGLARQINSNRPESIRRRFEPSTDAVSDGADTAAATEYRSRRRYTALPYESVGDCLHWRIKPVTHDPEAITTRNWQAGGAATDAPTPSVKGVATATVNYITLPNGAVIPCRHKENFPILTIPSGNCSAIKQRPQPPIASPNKVLTKSQSQIETVWKTARMEASPTATEAPSSKDSNETSETAAKTTALKTTTTLKPCEGKPRSNVPQSTPVFSNDLPKPLEKPRLEMKRWQSLNDLMAGGVGIVQSTVYDPILGMRKMVQTC